MKFYLILISVICILKFEIYGKNVRRPLPKRHHHLKPSHCPQTKKALGEAIGQFKNGVNLETCKVAHKALKVHKECVSKFESGWKLDLGFGGFKLMIDQKCKSLFDS